MCTSLSLSLSDTGLTLSLSFTLSDSHTLTLPPHSVTSNVKPETGLFIKSPHNNGSEDVKQTAEICFLTCCGIKTFFTLADCD